MFFHFYYKLFRLLFSFDISTSRINIILLNFLLFVGKGWDVKLGLV